MTAVPSANQAIAAIPFGGLRLDPDTDLGMIVGGVPAWGPA
ncbi:MAG TPA: hypothetical protein VNZ03_24590 [Terriglobales bacterium]|nr:hypothetical protein [Terriglobales bacterium]